MSAPLFEIDDVLGVPPGRAVMWFNVQGKRVPRCLIYADDVAALEDVGHQLLQHGMHEAVINYKTPDGEYLDVWVLRREMHLKKQQPLTARVARWWKGLFRGKEELSERPPVGPQEEDPGKGL